MIDALVHLFEPWKTLYSDSTVLSTTVTGLHILSLLIGGGLAIAADRQTLRALKRPVPDRWYHVAELDAVHRPVLIALTVLMATGVMLAAADVDTFIHSWVFWVKMGLIAMLLANGLMLANTERRLAMAHTAGATPAEPLWHRLGVTARASLTLWVLIAVGGAILPSIS